MDILVSGASIAGPAVAYWLARAGHRVEVVERTDGLRTAGHNVDVRGPGREVLRHMGIEDAVRAETTGEAGLRFVDGRGVLAEFPASQDDRSGATAEVEILRGRLARLIVDAGRPDVNYLFGDQIAELDPDDDGVTVRLAGGSTRRVDVVIIAEGARSRTRDRHFDGVTLRELGLYTAFGTIPRDRSDNDWWNWYNAVGGRSISVRPDNLGTTRVALSYLSGPSGVQDLPPAEQRAALSDVYAGAGWQSDRIRTALTTSDELYVDYLTQVRAPEWTAGPVVLLGDSAWCATPLSGIGTTLALTGAYVLAGEMCTAPWLPDALANYERRMRPLVDTAQKLPPGTPKLAHPRARAGVAALRTALRLAGSRPARALAGRFASPTAASTELPFYPALHA
ncbi:MAG: FAD-binding monooxygenase [Mycobacterium sp.]|nr:FAD-binding monooxygenase [Mycobacterium sp.]